MNESPKENNQISIREIYDILASYVYELWRFKWFYVILLVVLVIIGFYVSTKRHYFEGSLLFLVKEDNVTSHLNSAEDEVNFVSLGEIDDEINYPQIVRLAKTQPLLDSIVGTLITVNGVEDKVGNHIIKYYDVLDEWESDTLLAGYTFAGPNDTLVADSIQDTLTAEQIRLNEFKYYKANRLIARKLVEDKLSILKISHNKQTNILTIMGQSHIHDLAAQLPQLLYDELSEYYIKIKIEKHVNNFNLLTRLVDTTGWKLNRAEIRLAKYKDRNNSIFFNEDYVQRTVLERNVQLRNLIYEETVKNQELARYILLNATPFFRVIEAPHQPLITKKSSRILIIVGLVMVGMILLTVFIVIRKFLLDALRDPDEDETHDY